MLVSTLPNTSDYRFERKMPVERLSVAAAIALVRRHPAAFSEIYQQRTINSLYLDTVNHRCMHDAEEGIAERYKVRVRWYNDDATSWLEFKVRSGLVQRKERVELPGLNAVAASHAELNAAFAESALDAPVLQQLCGLTPSLCNTYERRYFLSADKRFRITVDWGICYRRHPALNRPVASNPLRPSVVVIELKYPTDADADAGQISSVFPMRVGRYSKYVEGLR